MNARQPLQNPDYTQELRSEKIRNIVGPMPPKLIRYGIGMICLAMAMVVSVSAFLPFRKVIRGIIYISEVTISTSDTVRVKARLRLAHSHSIGNPAGCKIICSQSDKEIKGVVSTYIPVRMEGGEYKVELQFKKEDMSLWGKTDFGNTEADFKIIISETSVLNRLLETFKIKKG